MSTSNAAVQVVEKTGRTAPRILVALLPPVVGSSVVLGFEAASYVVLAVFYLIVLLRTEISPQISTRSVNLLGGLVLALLLPFAIHGLYRGEMSPAIWMHTTAALVVASLCWHYLEHAPWRACFYGTALLVGLLVLTWGPSLQYNEVNATYLTLPLLALWLPVAAQDAIRRGTVAILPVVTICVVGLMTFSRSVTFSAGAALMGLVVYGFLIGQIRSRWAVAGLLVLGGLFVGLSGTTVLPADALVVARTVGEGLDTPRFQFWAEYLASFDTVDWLLGPPASHVDKFVLKTFGSISNTLHNTLLQIHSYGGLIAGGTVITGWIVVYGCLVRATGLLVHPVMLVLGVKGFFDVVAFPQRFDVVYAIVLFGLVARERNCPIESGRGRIVFTNLKKVRQRPRSWINFL